MAKLHTDKTRAARKNGKRRIKKAATVKKKSSARRDSAARIREDAVSPVGCADLTSVYRARMQLVGGLLNSAFDQVTSTCGGKGDDQCSDSDRKYADVSVRRVGQGAYLQIMGQVFAALFDLSQAIPTDELVKLSKIVAEQRRAETGARKAETAGGGAARRSSRKPQGHDLDTPCRNRALPESFGGMVQQIYGVSVTDSAAQRNGSGLVESELNADASDESADR